MFVWNLGICAWSRVDTLLFTKKNNKVYIEGNTYNLEASPQSNVFKKTKYITKDTLSFKHAIGSLKKESYDYFWIHSSDLTIVYKSDTLAFEKEKAGIISQLNFIEKYNSIMKLSYPLEPKFDSLPKPPPPPVLPE